MTQSGPMFATGGRLLLGDACRTAPGHIVDAEEAFHSLTNSSAIISLKTNHLDDAVWSGLRYSATGWGQSPIRFPKS